MKRWGYIEGEVDYKSIAEQVYLTADCARIMKDLGLTPPDTTYKSYSIMGKTFDPNEPEAYAKSFAITRA
jgi:nitrate/nitrite transport system substrate-binding protein